MAKAQATLKNVRVVGEASDAAPGAPGAPHPIKATSATPFDISRLSHLPALFKRRQAGLKAEIDAREQLSTALTELMDREAEQVEAADSDTSELAAQLEALTALEKKLAEHVQNTAAI